MNKAAFDVVSIRPSGPNSMPGMGITPTGYFSKGLTLWTPVVQAYFPKSNRYWRSVTVTGGPAWFTKTNYDIEAKLDGTTARDWKNLSNTERRQKMQPLLQAMLAERCKLVLHLVPVEIPGYGLYISKHGAKFKPSAQDQQRPTGGVPLASGGYILPHGRDEKAPRLTLVNVPMDSVAEMLMGSEAPIVDMTKLNGLYDLEIPRRDDLSPSGPEPATSYDLSLVGLELRPMKVPSVKLVIDHIEPPSQN